MATCSPFQRVRTAAYRMTTHGSGIEDVSVSGQLTGPLPFRLALTVHQ